MMPGGERELLHKLLKLRFSKFEYFITSINKKIRGGGGAETL